MSAASLPTAYEPSVVFLSFLVAVAASYVALSLARRVHAVDDRLVAAGWCLGGSVAMGSGIWAMHFVAMLGLTLPVELGYALAPTALSWLVAVAVSALALWLVSGGPTAQPLSPARWAGGALAMGAGICAMHYIGMAALHLEPGIRWRPGLVALSVAVAVAAAAVALALFRRLQRLDARQALRRQWVAALVLAGGISGLHYTGMAAAEFPLGAVCTSLDGLRGDRLAVLLGLSTLLLLTMTFGGALLDERLQARTRALTRSLGDAERELHEAAQHDALTGLLNRQGLDGRLAALATGGERRGVRAALVYVNLDGFKALNEQHGLVFGDGVLHAVAQRLKGLRREGDLLARLGADEFALLLVDDAAEGAIDRSTAMAVARRVIDALRLPLPMAQRELRLAASAGVALFPDDGPHGQLLAAATAAARAAKAAGGAQAAAFVPQMLLAAREQLELRDELRQALEQPVHAELMLHYQPKVRSDDGRVVGVEALLRWQHPRRGMVSPTVFVPLAERFGLIDRLGAWVIDEACAQMRAWRRHGLHLNVAVNLSMHQLRQPGLVAHVQKALQRCAVEPASLTFEITESAAMTEAEAVLPVFDQLAALGTRLSIDDFGTGYSSLAYLRRLPSRQVKVDRSFVQDLDTCSDARAIVEAVIRLAHALGLAVVAEGVETPRQREILQHLGCDELQGYLFARPVPAATLQRWARGADLPALLRFDAANDSPRHDTPMLQAG